MSTEALRAALEEALEYIQSNPHATSYGVRDRDHDKYERLPLIETIRAALAQPTTDPWRDTVDDMLVTCGGVASDDPRESVNRLINWHVQVALDPAVSSDAQALIDQGKALAQPSAEPVAIGHDSRILHELAGAASLCWEPKPTGVFHTERAIEIVEAALKELRESAAPPSTERKPLTDEQIAAIGKRMLGVQFGNTDVDFARAIERAVHGITDQAPK